MDASHPVSAKYELSTTPAAFGVGGPAALGVVDNSAAVRV
jgi:hypothetical protein